MINPIPENIEKLLQSDAYLIVPKYQRDYKWGYSEAGEFWEDLQDYLDKPEDSLFLGNIILDVQEKSSKKIKIIDGQQRITTIIILLVACRQLASKIGLDKLASATQKKIGFEDRRTGDYVGSRLHPSEAIKNVFEYICSDHWDGVFPDKIGNKPVKRQVNKIKPIYSFFWNEIKDYDASKLGSLLDAIYDSYVVRIDIENETEAFKIFERTNARGIDLEASDLLKNHLFSNLGESIEDKWVNITELSNGTLLKMLKHFYASKKGRISKTNLYKKLKEYSKQITPSVLIEELEKFAEFYNSFQVDDSANFKNYLFSSGLKSITQHEDNFIDVFSAVEALRLFKITQIYPVIYSALECYKRCNLDDTLSSGKMLVSLFQTLEKYHFINNAVCERIGNEVESLYYDFSDEFARSTNFNETLQALRNKLKKQLANREEFVSRFTEISYQVSTIPLIVYIFDRVSNAGRVGAQKVAIFNSDERVLRKSHNIEHFYPQKPGPTLHKLNEQDINNIGNLICINHKVNSSLSNLAPIEKANKLKTDLLNAVEITPYVRDFLIKYDEHFSDWNADSINKRSSDLAIDGYEKVWNI